MQSLFRKKGLSARVVLPIFLGGLLVGLAYTFNSVQAKDSSDQVKYNQIAYSCSSIKLSLKKLQQSDALARVSLGRNYEEILNKLMTGMNGRLVANHKYTGNLPTITARFNENFEYFKKNYIAYDQQVSHLLSIDCSKKPEEFYSALEDARQKRDEVRFNYEFINNLISSYMTELESVKEEIGL